MGRGIVAGDNLVERKHRAEIKVRLLAEFPVDLVHVPAQLFQQALHTVEHRIQRGLVSGEVGPHKVLEDRRVAVSGAPELSRLLQSAMGPGALRFAVLRDQFRFHPGDGLFCP